MIRNAAAEAMAGPSRLTHTTVHRLSSLYASSSIATVSAVQVRHLATHVSSARPYVGKGKARAIDATCSCAIRSHQPVRLQHSFVRTVSPSGEQARIQLKSTRNGVFGLSTSRGTRAYQEDTASVSCLHVDPQELRTNYLKHHTSGPGTCSPGAAAAALEWNPEKAGGPEIAGQVVWFGCFDGHGGQQVSSFLRDQLHKTFESVQPDMVTDTVQYTRELGGYFRRFTGGLLERWVRKDRLKPVRAGQPAGAAGRRAVPRKDATTNTSNDSKTASTSTPQQQQQQQQPQQQHISDPASLSEMLSHGSQDPPSPSSSSPTLSSSASASGPGSGSGNTDKAAQTTSNDDPSSDRPVNKPIETDGAVKIGGSSSSVGDTVAGGGGGEGKGEGEGEFGSLIERIAVPEGMEGERLSMAERLTLAWLVADRQIQTSPALDVGGSTASVTLLHSLDMPGVPWYSARYVGLYVAHVGDTRVLMCSASDGRAIPLTSYHHPDDRAESERLRKMGAGMITDSFGEARWMGALANTRSFGDSRFKRVGITSEPEIFSQVIPGDDFSFIISFSDGIGGVMSDQEIVDLCRNSPHPSHAAQRVLTFAEELGAQDNGTVIVIPLRAWNRQGGNDSTKLRRELRRDKIDLYRDNRQ
ncbi:protein serine/threonine phosphatase 2C [Testicularia cyperi]|uniref:Protein serine/threonine phosphatase 2C n=1 Tax=Testicularia cyperi TaxID=1882483 RepID=A0A317XHU8_9BASI|nr:protein serine/threonine phosphatase 2C [Testicularia cyperi]